MSTNASSPDSVLKTNIKPQIEAPVPQMPVHSPIKRHKGQNLDNYNGTFVNNNLGRSDPPKVNDQPRTIQPQVGSLTKNDLSIKRPMNLVKPEPPILPPRNDSNFIHKPKPIGYQMRTSDAAMAGRQNNDYEGVTLATSTQSEGYNNLFQNGMEPPILNERNKRNRRLSSIVGVKTS